MREGNVDTAEIDVNQTRKGVGENIASELGGRPEVKRQGKGQMFEMRHDVGSNLLNLRASCSVQDERTEVSEFSQIDLVTCVQLQLNDVKSGETDWKGSIAAVDGEREIGQRSKELIKTAVDFGKGAAEIARVDVLEDVDDDLVGKVFEASEHGDGCREEVRMGKWRREA